MASIVVWTHTLLFVMFKPKRHILEHTFFSVSTIIKKLTQLPCAN